MKIKLTTKRPQNVEKSTTKTEKCDILKSQGEEIFTGKIKVVFNKPILKSHNGLVKVAVTVNGKNGQYQSHRWKKPDVALEILKQSFKAQGVDIDNVTFKTKKGNTHTQQEVLDSYLKGSRQDTIQNFVKKNYKLIGGVSTTIGSKQVDEKEQPHRNEVERHRAELLRLIEEISTSTEGSDGFDSLAKHTDKNGKLTPEREMLHKNIILGYFENKKPAEGQATYIVMGGGSGSGKGYVLDSGLISEPKDTVRVDSDKIKGQLPEYGLMLSDKDELVREDAARYTHEESSALTKRIQAIAFKLNYNFLLDGTGDGSSKSLGSKLKQARENGYKVVGEYVTISTDEAIKRAAIRAEETGRDVPLEIIKNTHKMVTQRFVEFVSEFDEIRLYDNTNQPVLIAEGRKGEEVSVLSGHNQQYEDFVRKGEL